ncbi:outer membrane lipoprotein chaperone LolA [Thiogranum longum]|nr:outer membrane lipoprotein chaperone LolA [Thiogranum longum]
MRSILLLRLFMVVSAALSFAVEADPVSDYFSALKTFEAKFTQRVVDANGELIQESGGEVWISKPGRFRWNYTTPYHQIIVADGERLWNYDADLEQASVSPIDETLTSTPAMLLSGLRPLSEIMNTTAIGLAEDVAWFRLQPKGQDAAVETVRIGLHKGQLKVIEVRDNFGNQTRIRFSDIRLNQPLDEALFRLEFPPGTDVIGDIP